MLAASHHHRLVLGLIPSHSLFRWLVWIRRSRGNGWVLIQRSHVLFQLWQPDLQYPCVGEEYVVAFLGIVHQVVESRHRVLSKYTISCILFFQVDFPVTPLNAKYIVSHVYDKSLST